MAKKSSVEKNKHREKLVKQYAARRKRLKGVAEDQNLTAEERFAARLKLAELSSQNFFYAVTQQTRWNGIDRQESTFKVVDAQQVLTVCNQIAIPVFVLLQVPPDRVPSDWRFFRKVVFPFPRVQCHGSPIRESTGIVFS